jgi:hypothetical protein
MQIHGYVLGILCSLLAVSPAIPAPAAGNDRVQLALDTTEADQVLTLLALLQTGKPINDAAWRTLFSTVPYVRLKERQQRIAVQFHDSSLVLSDEAFKKFVLSADLRPRASALRATLERWQRTDLRHSAKYVLSYLPDSAVIRAKVYPVIKPGTNSFVWDLKSDPTIFLYLDPEVTAAKFENTVAHELHHIGLGSLGPVYTQRIAGLPGSARAAAGWMASFGEGLAMLAAAGGPDVDPHAASTSKEHARWVAELANFDADLPAVDAFFHDILAGTLSEDAIEAKGSSFFGEHQGPWYTVGYRMAVVVEKRFGRAILIRTMLDYRCLLALYNQAAAEQNGRGGKPLPLWSESALAQVSAGTCGAPPVSKP